MLNLTKYKQKIIKALIAVANCLFFMQLKKIFKGKIQKIVLYFLAIFGLSLLFWQFHFKAVLSDSLMMILACLLSSYFVGLNLNTNIIILIISIYILPYAIYN